MQESIGSKMLAMCIIALHRHQVKGAASSVPGFGERCHETVAVNLLRGRSGIVADVADVADVANVVV
jgi:hypothetical protein